MRRVVGDARQHLSRGQPARQRQAETLETEVVWLITQRSQVQILPPLPRSEADSEQGIGFCLSSVRRFCARADRSARREFAATVKNRTIRTGVAARLEAVWCRLWVVGPEIPVVRLRLCDVGCAAWPILLSSLHEQRQHSARNPRSHPSLS